MKRYILTGMIIVGVVVGGVLLWQKKNSVSAPPSSIASDFKVKGPETAPITIIEFSDFQCPACGSYYPIVKQLYQEFGDEIQFVYRNFPLRQIHSNAQLAGQAAEAAGRQDKFWGMHDMIFENQKTWSDQKSRQAEEAFIAYAGLW